MRDADFLIPEVEIVFNNETLGIEKHKVKCNYGLFLRFQKYTGKNPFDPSVLKSMSAEDHVKFLACGIYKDDPDAHIDELAEKMTLAHQHQIWEIISVFSETSKDLKKKDENPTK